MMDHLLIFTVLIITLSSSFAEETYWFKVKGWSGSLKEPDLAEPEEKLKYFTGFCVKQDYNPTFITAGDASKIIMQKPDITVSKIKDVQGIRLHLLMERKSENERLIATLMQFVILGLTISTMFIPVNAIGASAGILGVLVALYPHTGNIFFRHVGGGHVKGYSVELLVGKLVHNLNKRFDDMADYVTETGLELEKDLIEREYSHMLSMYLECGRSYQHAIDERRENDHHALDEHEECLVNAYRYIHSGLDKFALFGKEMENNPEKCKLVKSSLSVNQARRMSRNLVSYNLYIALLYDVSTEISNLYWREAKHSSIDYAEVRNEVFSGALLYLKRFKAEMLFHHTHNNLENCYQTIHCEEQENLNKGKDDFSYLGCSCIIDTLLFGNNARCYTDVIVTNKKSQKVKISDKVKSGPFFAADGDSPMEAVASYLSHNPAALGELAIRYSEELKPQFDQYWEWEINHGYLLLGRDIGIIHEVTEVDILQDGNMEADVCDM